MPVWERLRRWDTSSLPLATDLLVYSRAEWESLPQWNPKLADVLARDGRWLVGWGKLTSMSPLPSTWML